MKITTILFSLLIASCGTVTVTEQGTFVKLIDENQAKNCKLIGTSHLTNVKGAGPEACARNAHIAIKNIVAELGGNAYLTTSEKSVMCVRGGTGIDYQAFSCPE